MSEMQPSKILSSVFPIMPFKGLAGGPYENSRKVGRDFSEALFSAKWRRRWEFTHFHKVVHFLIKTWTVYSMHLRAPSTIEMKLAKGQTLLYTQHWKQTSKLVHFCTVANNKRNGWSYPI